jgi:hypothetical protein
VLEVLRPSAARGNCTAPGECSCADGWGGHDCSEPQCEGGCAGHGACVAPGQCKCFDGWNGTSCTVPEAHTHPFDLVCGTLVPRPRLERRAVRGASLPGQLLEPRPVREPRRESDGRSPLVSSPTCHPVCEHGTRHGERASCACFEGWQGVRCEEPSLPIELSSAWSVHGARMCLLEPVHVFLYSCIMTCITMYHVVS